MQLVSEGQGNIMLTGNPKKTFFKTTYSHFTNFGLQKFRVDFEGSKTLRLNEESVFVFKIPRYADMLMDCYLSVALPHIWSPIMPPRERSLLSDMNGQNNTEQWAPYEFKWIENIGAKMISRISIVCGNYTLQEYSGNYLLASVQRDFNVGKINLFNEMIGNVKELNDPGNSGARVNSYPNAYYSETLAGPDPSIRGRILYIPLNNWFGLKSQMAFPLTSLQYNELNIIITMRPINELFQIRDVMDSANNYPYISPNFNSYYMQLYRFLQPPPDIPLEINSYTDTRTSWNTDMHLNCTYCFLSNEEERVFALEEQKYLIKQVHEQRFFNMSGSSKVKLECNGMVSNWLFYFQRSDVNLRNEWSNYTNWPYNYLPVDIIPAPTNGNYLIYRTTPSGQQVSTTIGPGVNPNGNLTGWLITPTYTSENEKNILLTLGVVLDGSYRENMQPAGVFNYVEKYIRTSGNAPFGLYCYNFSINSNNAEIQPSGAMNMNKYTNIELEFTTNVPPIDPLAQTLTVCNPETGDIIGINKPMWRIYDYTYDLYFFEERINIIHFIGGNVGMMYAN